MKLSIIIVNWNVCEILRECLHSVYRYTHLLPTDFEVFVVDNASSDGSVAMLQAEFPQVRLMANTDNVGFGRANDQALPECQGEYVLLLNPDTLLFDDAIDRLLQHIEAHPDVAITGCRLLNTDHSLQRWTGGSFPGLWNIACHYFFIDLLLPKKLNASPLYLESDHQQDIDIDWVSGAVMMIRRSCLDGRLFNPDFFMYGEDMELCYRMKQHGWRVLYTPVCSIVHIQGASMKKQEGDILLSSLKGLRSFYAMIHGRKLLWLVDAITISGFALRLLCYSLLDLARPGKGYADKKRSSLNYIRITRKIMRQAA